MMNDFPKATLEQSPRILREEADVRESNASGMSAARIRTCRADADGLRYLASLIELGDYPTAFAMTQEWDFCLRSFIPSAVFYWMDQAHPAYKMRHGR